MCQFGWHFGFWFNICLCLICKLACICLVNLFLTYLLFYCGRWLHRKSVYLPLFFAKTRMSASPGHKGRNWLQSVSTKICRRSFWGKWLKWGRMVWWSKARWTSMRDLAKVSRNAAEVLRRDSSSERASSRGMLSEASWNCQSVSFQSIASGALRATVALVRARTQSSMR